MRFFMPKRSDVVRAALANERQRIISLEPGWTATAERPQYPRPGVWAYCRIVQLIADYTDFVLVRLPGCEIQVALLNCIGPSLFVDGRSDHVDDNGRAAQKLFWSIVDKYSTPILYLPQPPNDRGFFKQIRPGSKWPGVIYFAGASHSLNDQLLLSGLYSRPILRNTPRTIHVA